MKIRAAVSLVSAVATLALVLSLIACGETKGDGETASVVHPEVPNIPIATSSVTEAPRLQPINRTARRPRVILLLRLPLPRKPRPQRSRSMCLRSRKGC